MELKPGHKIPGLFTFIMYRWKKISGSINREIMKREIRKFQFTFDEEQIQVLVAGLHELPGKVGMPVIHRIRDQITEQNKKENHI